jgi:tetratricopeptide (TPR) repeat protein
MAPEQFHSQPLTPAADQYALAIVAYEMLTGKKPFDGNTLAEIITQHLFSPPPDIRQDRPDLPTSVSETLVHMLAKEPAARFPDLDAAIVALGAPDPSKMDSVRGRLMSIARSTPAKKPRLSVPLSPIPATRPSAPTAVVGSKPRPVTAPTAPGMASRAQRRATLWAIGIAALLVVGVGVGVGRREMLRRTLPERNPALRRGVRLWQQGNAAAAVPEFTSAAQQLPRSAMPHVYLSRLARERGDLSTAFDEAARATELEPRNAVALRELGAVLLARGDFEGARRFFVRALRVNPRDAASMGWLACSLHRLGDAEQAARWSARAGPGAWSSCLRVSLTP